MVWYIKGEKVNVWRCTSRLDSSAEDCPARTINESDLHDAVCTAVNTCWANRDAVIPALKENIESVVGTDYEDEIEIIDEMIRKKQKELLDSGCAGYNGFSIWRYRRNGLNTRFYGRSRMQSYCK